MRRFPSRDARPRRLLSHRVAGLAVLLWTVFAALAAPVAELDDLLEAAVAAPRWAGRSDHHLPSSVGPAPAAPATGAEEEEGLVEARYVLLLPARPVVETSLPRIGPLRRPAALDPPALFERRATLERGPPSLL